MTYTLTDVANASECPCIQQKPRMTLRWGAGPRSAATAAAPRTHSVVALTWDCQTSVPGRTAGPRRWEATYHAHERRLGADPLRKLLGQDRLTRSHVAGRKGEHWVDGGCFRRIRAAGRSAGGHGRRHGHGASGDGRPAGRHPFGRKRRGAHGRESNYHGRPRWKPGRDGCGRHRWPLNHVNGLARRHLVIVLRLAIVVRVAIVDRQRTAVEAAGGLIVLNLAHVGYRSAQGLNPPGGEKNAYGHACARTHIDACRAEVRDVSDDVWSPPPPPLAIAVSPSAPARPVRARSRAERRRRGPRRRSPEDLRQAHSARHAQAPSTLGTCARPRGVPSRPSRHCPRA